MAPRTRLRPGLRGDARSQSGATAVEYALILVGVAVLVVGVGARLGDTVQTAYTAAGAELSADPAAIDPGGTVEAPPVSTTTAAATTTAATTTAATTTAATTTAATTTAATTTAATTTAATTSAPVTTPAAPTATQPAGSTPLTGTSPVVFDVGVPTGKAQSPAVSTISPAGKAIVAFDANNQMVVTPNTTTRPVAVTVTFTYGNGKTGTKTFWLT